MKLALQEGARFDVTSSRISRFACMHKSIYLPVLQTNKCSLLGTGGIWGLNLLYMRWPSCLTCRCARAWPSSADTLADQNRYRSYYLSISSPRPTSATVGPPRGGGAAYSLDWLKPRRPSGGELPILTYFPGHPPLTHAL